MKPPLRRRVLRPAAALALLLLLTVVPLAAQKAAPRYVVIAPVANLYRSATEDADVVSQAICGSNVARLEKKRKWFRVRTADDYTGWVRAALLKKLDPGPYAAGGPVAEVTSLGANIYREMDVTKHAPLLRVPFETRLEITNPQADSSGRWLAVRLPDGRTGYLQSGDAGADPKALSAAETIALAKKFLGVTYTWGGTSSFGYDCSGFMQMLMRRRGVLLPRDAGQQAAWSGLMPVERPDLQPGDLLYFGAAAEKITHTGMYIGEGQFIHDTTRTQPMVQIGQLDEPHWTRLLVAIRRLK